MRIDYRTTRLLGALILSIVSAGSVCADTPEPADTVIFGSLLEGITIESEASRKLLLQNSDGSVNIDARNLSSQPSFMGSNDPLTIARSLPAVQTTNDLQAAFPVRGGNNGANTFTTDGALIYNPLHLLGLFSAFNPAFYSSYIFSAGYFPATDPNTTGGLFKAESGAEPDTSLNGNIAIGLIESHAAIGIPLSKGNTSLSLAGRTTYLNLLFPNILQLGTSRLNYRFTDLNASLKTRLTERDLLTVSLFGNSDKMSLSDRNNGAKEGNFGWSNLAASAVWRHLGMTTSASFSRFSNIFRMQEGGRSLDLPSDILDATLRWSMPVKHFTFESDLSYHFISQQFNRANENSEKTTRNAWEWNAAASANFAFQFVNIEAGLRNTLYLTRHYCRTLPQPRLSVNFPISPAITPFIRYGRYVLTRRLIQESTAGLPADFFTLASGKIPYDDTHSLSIGLSGRIPILLIDYNIEGYGKILRNSPEFKGSLIDLMNPEFQPEDHIDYYNGYSAGLSVTLMRQFGNIRGRLSYNFGATRLKENDQRWFAASSDRPHDLNVTVNWTPVNKLDIGISFVYATGTPYTKALYGYMIGENMICQYMPHNSSRLPDYKRLDLSANWTFLRRGRMQHSLCLSVYNVAAFKNILFIYTSYSTTDGIINKKSVMKNVIPSLTYSLEF